MNYFFFRVAARIPDANLRFAMQKNIAECDRLQKELDHLIRNGKGDTKEVIFNSLFLLLS